MSCCDSLLTRLPLSGVSVHSYDTQMRGEACKTVNILSRLALLIIGSLIIVNTFPTTYMMPVVGCLAGGVFLSFVAGSNSKRRASEVFLELIIASVCVAMVILAGNKLTYIQSGIGMVAAIGAGIVIGIPAERGKVTQIIPIQGDQIDFTRKAPNRAIPSLPIRVLDYIIGVSRDGATSAISMFKGLFNRHRYRDTIISKDNCTALCVLIHGLASRPAILDDFYNSISSFSGITIFQPFVTKNGECSLAEAETSIKEQIETWAKKHTTKPIIMIGHSNGARIAGSISSQLVLSNFTNPMEIHCVAGPFHGTEFVNRPTWCNRLQNGWQRLFKYLYSTHVFNELSYDNDNTMPQLLIRQMGRANGESSKIRYHFYATTSDALVFPYDSAYPNIGPAACYYLVDGDGHQGILSAAHDTIVDKARTFYENTPKS